MISKELENYINTLNITNEEKKQLKLEISKENLEISSDSFTATKGKCPTCGR